MIEDPPTKEEHAWQEPRFEVTLEYLKINHAYISSLHQLMDTRAHFIIVTNAGLLSAILVALSFLSDQTALRPILSAFLAPCSLLFLVSIVLALWGLNPRVFDPESMMHTSSISSQVRETYSARFESLTIAQIILELSRENHALSRIVEDERRCILWANRTLLIALLLVGLLLLYLVIFTWK